MTKCKSEPAAAIDANSKHAESLDDAQRGRRESLKNIGRFAAYTAPAMTVLLNANPGLAQNNGNGNGNGNGNSPGNSAGRPNCDNPGLHLGFGNNHHSPC